MNYRRVGFFIDDLARLHGGLEGWLRHVHFLVFNDEVDVELFLDDAARLSLGHANSESKVQQLAAAAGASQSFDLGLSLPSRSLKGKTMLSARGIVDDAGREDR